MTTTVSEVGVSEMVTPARPRVTRPLRPGRGTGRRAQPQARPGRPLEAPRLTGAQRSGATSCRVERPREVAVALVGVPTAGPAVSWRLTERGIALVLLTGLALATAAMVVVGMTALRVTGDQYVQAGQIASWQQ